MAQEIEDCCGTTLHIGVNAQGKARFDKKPPKDLGCEPQACVVRWMRAEDCDESSNGSIELACQKASPSGPGLCMTHVKPK